MLYINNPNTKAKTYDHIVKVAIAHGVEPKRVYLYLAMMGVTGRVGRLVDSDGSDYMEPVKIAVKGKDLVTGVHVCEACGGLVFDTQGVVYDDLPAVRASGSPAFDIWVALSANSYRSAEHAYELSGLSKSLTLRQFTELFKENYDQNNSGEWEKH